MHTCGVTVPLTLRATCLIAGATAAVVFLWQQWCSPRPEFDLRVFSTLAMAGTALLAAMLLMLLLPLIGGRLETHWEWRRMFPTAFGLIAISDSSLVIAALSDGTEMLLGATAAGMATIGVGAALANLAVVGSRPGSCAVNSSGHGRGCDALRAPGELRHQHAALGLMLAAVDAAAAFARSFAHAAFTALPGVIAVSVLLPAKPLQHSTQA
jgi:hypothetical protein